MESDNHQPVKSLPQSTSRPAPPPPAPGLTVCLANNFNLLKRFQSGDRARNKHLILYPPPPLFHFLCVHCVLLYPPPSYTRVAKLGSVLLLDIKRCDTRPPDWPRLTSSGGMSAWRERSGETRVRPRRGHFRFTGSGRVRLGHAWGPSGRRPSRTCSNVLKQTNLRLVC